MKRNDIIFVILGLLAAGFTAQRCCNDILTDGSSSYSLEEPKISNTDAVTISLWLTPAEDGVYDVVECVDPDDTSLVYISTNQVWFLNRLITSFTVASTSYLCLVWNKASGVAFYLDGEFVKADSSVTDTELDFSGTWQIGKQLSDRYESEGGLIGSTCGISIWSSALSPEDVRRMYAEESGEEDSEGGNDSEGDSEGEDSQTYSTAQNQETPDVTWEDFVQSNTTLESSKCSESTGSGIRLGNLDAVSSKFVILFLVIIGVVIGFSGLFLCSEREIALKRANVNKRLTKDDHFSIENGSTHSIT